MNGGALAAGGYATVGHGVGILTLDTRHPLLPGNVQHARSFARPVLYEPIHCSDPRSLMRGEPALAPLVVAGALRLQEHGVSLIAGACGSFAYYQREVAEAAHVPVFLSIMTQVSFLLGAIGRAHKLGILCAVASALAPRVFDACAISDPSRLVIREMQGQPEFDAMLAGADHIDVDRMTEEVVRVAECLVADAPEVSALMLQCSELPPFGAAIQAATRRPVFDMTILIRSLCEATEYPVYPGRALSAKRL